MELSEALTKQTPQQSGVVWGVVVGFDHENGTHEITIARANLTEDEAAAVLHDTVKGLLEKGIPTDKIHWKTCRHRTGE